MTIYFPNHSITIYRMRRKGNTDRSALSATLTSYNMDIQPATLLRGEHGEGRFGEVFEGFIDSSIDIKEGDQVVDNTGKRYSVKGVAHYESAGMLDHKHLEMVAKDSNYA